MLKNHLSKLVDINHYLIYLTPKINLPEKIAFNKQNYTKIYLEKARKYILEIGQSYDFEDNLAEIQNYNNNLEPSLNHGDFVPWHIFESGQNLYLIDAEHCSKTSPLYYDVAYFFHRVYTSAESTELAVEYITIFRDQLNNNLRNDFDSKFRTLMSNRIIGGFFDAKNDKTKNMHFHNELQEKFLARRMY